MNSRSKKWHMEYGIDGLDGITNYKNSDGIARVHGMTNVQAEELVE